MANGDMTEREIDVWGLVAEGYNNEGISNELCIEIKTVERHITNIMNKTKAKRPSRFHARVWLALNFNGRPHTIEAETIEGKTLRIEIG